MISFYAMIPPSSSNKREKAPYGMYGQIFAKIFSKFSKFVSLLYVSGNCNI